jgi:hypothetical protein
LSELISEDDKIGMLFYFLKDFFKIFVQIKTFEVFHPKLKHSNQNSITNYFRLLLFFFSSHRPTIAVLFIERKKIAANWMAGTQ